MALSVCITSGLTAPDSTEQCNVIQRVRRTGELDPCPIPENFMFETSEWSACTETCRRGRRTRTVECREIDRETIRLRREYPDRVCTDLGHTKPHKRERLVRSVSSKHLIHISPSGLSLSTIFISDSLHGLSDLLSSHFECIYSQCAMCSRERVSLSCNAYLNV